MWIVSLLGGWRATVFAALLVGCAGYALTQAFALTSARMTIATMERNAETARAEAESRARESERALAAAAAAASEMYERGKVDAQAVADRVVADLRAGNLRLREEWRGCQVSGTAPAAGKPDAAAAIRERRASRIVRAAAACDAQVKALQALVLADRSES